MNLSPLLAEEINLFLSLILLCLLIFIIIVISKCVATRARPLPPGPYAWPIVGNISLLARKNPHAVLPKLSRVHGPLMSLRFGARLVVVGSSPAAAEEILRTNDRLLSGRYVSRPVRVKGSKLHNLNLAFSEKCDRRWRSVRSIYKAEVFSGKVMEAQAGVREEKVMEMVKQLEGKKGQVVKIKETVFCCALNILSNTLFSIDLTDFEGKGVGEGLCQNIREYTKMGAVPQLSDLYPIVGGCDLQGYYKKLMVMFDRITCVWADVVKERRNQLALDGSWGPPDLTNALIRVGFNDDQINALLVELFGAGTEPINATTEWALAELLRSEDAMQKLRNELAQVINGDRVRECDLPNLPYLQACVKETLRLHPPGPLLLPHRAVQTCEVMGYTIPKDTQVLVNVWAISRDPVIWDDPLSFKPERFLVSGLHYKGINFEYLPFGSGRRMCPALPLVSRVLPLILASLIHHFDWLLPGSMTPADIDMSETLDVAMLKEERLQVIPKLRSQLKTASMS